jgi:hypothetical protein
MAIKQATACNLGTIAAAGDTDTLDRGPGRWERTAMLKINTTAGGSPTMTLSLLGSADGSTWFPVPWSDSATYSTVSMATFTQNSTTITYKFLWRSPWRYFKITTSVVNNVSAVIDIFSEA